jgi:hypothetical protein
MPTNIEGDIYEERLYNPTKVLTLEQIYLLTNKLASYEGKGDRKKLFTLVFAGHGSINDGALELSNGTISALEVFHVIKEAYEGCKTRLHLDLILT